MPTYQIWLHQESDSIGVATEDECCEAISNNEDIELIATFEDLETAEIAAMAIADEMCLEYKLIN